MQVEVSENKEVYFGGFKRSCLCSVIYRMHVSVLLFLVVVIVIIIVIFIIDNNLLKGICRLGFNTKEQSL